MGSIFGSDDVAGLINEVGGEVIISANTTVDGDLTITGDLDFSGANTDILHVDSIFGSTSILPVRIGDAATTSHSLASEDDLLVTGKLEVDGATYWDAAAIFYGSSTHNAAVIMASSADLILGASGITGSLLNGDSSLGQTLLGLGSVCGRQLVIGAADYYNSDFDHAVQTNPTLFIHSVKNPDTANDEWISFSHDGTDGTINTGTGDVNFNTPIETTTYRSSVTNGSAFTVSSNILRVSQNDDELRFGLDSSTGRMLIFTDSANYTEDHGHATTTDPTLFIHSATAPGTANTEWGSLSFAGTGAGAGNFNIATGVGNIALLPVSSVLVGPGANTTDFSAAKMIVSQSDTGATLAAPMGIVGEGSATVTLPGGGVYGAGRAHTGNAGYGLYGSCNVNATGDTATAHGVQGDSTATHAGGDNVAILGYAINGDDNIAFDASGGVIRLNNYGIAADTNNIDDNKFYVSAVDLSAGNTQLDLYGEGTCIGSGTPTADKTVAIKINGTQYYLLASTSAT